MAFLNVKHVSIKGVAACVPSQVVDNEAIYKKWGGYENFFHSTGIARHRNATEDICTSDLVLKAAERLIEDLKWDKDKIGAIVFVSQTPDYNNIPATSNTLQARLGLPSSCMAIDIALGCSGWVHALAILSSLMQEGTIQKGLLLAGDTISRLCSESDKSTFPLFGDAGTATALEYDEESRGLQFNLLSDGAGYEAIIVRDGGCRSPFKEKSLAAEEHGDGIIRNRLQLELDGMSVFSFGISKVPAVVNQLIEQCSIDKDNVDYFTFHQANMFMNDKIRKKLKLIEDKVPYSMSDFGNTSCASIPLTLVTQCKAQLRTQTLQHIGCGFGVGLSWGAVRFDTDKIAVPELVEI